MENYITIGIREVLKMFAKCVVKHLIKPKKYWIVRTIKQIISIKDFYMEVIGRIKNEEKEYWVLGNSFVYGGNDGLGNFSSFLGVGTAAPNIGFLGCASKEIARH